eukprot:gene206-820_t
MPISKKKGLDDFYGYDDREDNGGLYDDDFDSDSGKEDKSFEASKPSKSGGNNKKTTERSPRYGSVQSDQLDSARKQYGSAFSKSSYSTGGGYKRRKDNKKRVELYKPPPSNPISQRVLSARRNKINTLQNLVLELQNENEQLRIEIRDLKRSSRIQEKAIKRLDNEEADLPLLLQKHHSEVSALKEKLKKQKERSERAQEEVKKKDLELLKLRDKVRKFEEITKEKRLDEREKLQSKLERLQLELGEKDGKISELEKVVKLSEKVRMREIKDRNDKYKKAIEELRRLENMQKDLQDKFKEKEKELHTQNIYSQRIVQKRKAMKSQQLILESRLDDTPMISRMGDAETPRPSRMKESNERDGALVGGSGGSKQAASDVDVETMVSALRRREEELEKMLEEERRLKQFEDDKRRLKEMEEKIKQKQLVVNKAADKQRDEDEMRKEQLRREEESKKMREYEEEKKRMAAEVELRSRQREEELKIIQRLEEEKVKEEQRRRDEELSKDRNSDEISRSMAEQRSRQLKLEEQLKSEQVIIQNEEDETRKKKEMLLARMKAIDSGRSANNDDRGTEASTFVTETQYQSSGTRERKKTSNFLERSSVDDKEDFVKYKPLDFSAKRRSSKEDNSAILFHSDVNNKKTNQQDLSFGGYNPTVGPGSGKKRVSQYKKPENEGENFLFFDKSGKSDAQVEAPRKIEKKKDEDVLFFDTKKAKAPVPIDKPVDNKKPDLIRNRTRSISDDDSHMFTIGGVKKNPEVFRTERSTGSGKQMFGSYEPTFGNPDSANSARGNSSGRGSGIGSPGSDPFSDDGPRFGRRQRQQKASTPLGDLSLASDGKKLGNLGAKSLSDNNRRKVDAIDSFVDDDIEEMVLS